jgi:hypothetical protein
MKKIKVNLTIAVKVEDPGDREEVVNAVKEELENVAEWENEDLESLLDWEVPDEDEESEE